MTQLKESEFGKPHPRHGLKLLYWFACHCVKFVDDQPFLKYNPRDGEFGFKDFHNNEDLLPDQDNPYYEVGNLNSDRASELPEYVQEHYDSEQDITNADRIIICLDYNNEYLCLDRVYVTRHHDQWNFDQNHTYRISKGLLKIISNFSDYSVFLRNVGYYVEIQGPAESRITIFEGRPPISNQRSPSSQRQAWTPTKSQDIVNPERALPKVIDPSQTSEKNLNTSESKATTTSKGMQAKVPTPTEYQCINIPAEIPSNQSRSFVTLSNHSTPLILSPARRQSSPPPQERSFWSSCHIL